MKVPVKLIALFGMADHPKAFVLHELSPTHTNARVIEGHPEFTKYWITWYCGKSGARVKLFRTPPENLKPCKRCIEMKKLFEIRGHNPTRDQIIDYHRTQARQAPF